MRIITARRTAAALVTSVVALSTVGVAQAGKPGTEWQGATEGQSAFLGFDINKVNNKRVVQNITYSGSATCNGEPSSTFGFSEGGIRITNNAFEGKRDFVSPVSSQQDGTVTIDGRQMKGGVFRGTVQIKQVFPNGPETTRCNTGKLDYEVDKFRPQRG